MSDPQQFTNTTDSRFTRWEKSPASGPSEGCLYVSPAADGSGDVGLADSKAGATGPVTILNRTEWTAFLTGAKSGAFDHI